MKRHTRLALIVAILVAIAIPGVAQHPSEDGTARTADTGPTFVAYYFFGNMRCATCRKLEAYSEEAITDAFGEDLASGTLAWRAVNVDEPDNTHFVHDFDLVTKSLVLVEYRDGGVVRFSNLTKIWQKVGDKDEFLEYVRDSTREFIGES